MGLEGTRWRRKTDDAEIIIDADSDSSGRSNRSLLARNLATERSFWLTPEGLGRKYELL